LAWFDSKMPSMSIFSSLARFVIWYASSVRRPALFTASSVPEIITSLRDICVLLPNLAVTLAAENVAISSPWN
jgi:hypothetical protein